MPLGIPADLTATQEVWGGTVTLNWTDTPPDCTPPPSFTATGGDGTGLPDTTIKSSVKQWTLNSFGNVSWGVSGTGASIDQNGNLTTTALACGTIIITATDSCCGGFTQKVRVTDGGAWFLQSTDHSGRTAYRNCVNNQYQVYTDSCEVINGDIKIRTEFQLAATTSYYGEGICPNIYYTCGVSMSTYNNSCNIPSWVFSVAGKCGANPAEMTFRSWYYVPFSIYTYHWCCPGGC